MSSSLSPFPPPAAYHVVMQVWGEVFTRMLTELCLPALLSPGNIPALAASAPTVLKLYTTDADMARIEASPSYNVLKSYVSIDYRSLDAIPAGDKYAEMTAMHRHVVREAFDDDAALVWLVPDSVWADGSLRTVVRAVAAGKRAVMHSAVKVNGSTALPYFQARLAGRPVVTIDPRELVQVALDHMHRYYRAWMWDGPKFSRNPANIYWRVGSDGLLIRGFHLHPLMLYPERRVADFVSTFDDDLPLLACPTFADIYVATDSDEAFHVDLADENWCPDILTVRGRPTAWDVAMWAASCGNLHHRRFVDFRIRAHAGPIDESAWRQVERGSDRVISAVRRWLWIWAALARPLEYVFRLSRAEFLEAAALQGLSPGLHPKPPQWYSKVEAFARARRLTWVARRLTSIHKFAVRHTFFVVFGKTVTWQGLQLDRRLIIRGRHRLRTLWWRIIWPKIWRVYKWMRLFIRYSSRNLRVFVDRASTRLRRARRRTMRTFRECPESLNRALRALRRRRRDWAKDGGRAVDRLTARIAASARGGAKRMERARHRLRKRSDKIRRNVRRATPLRSAARRSRLLLRRAYSWRPHKGAGSRARDVDQEL